MTQLISSAARRERGLNSPPSFDFEAMRNVDIRTVDPTTLADIRDIDITKLPTPDFICCDVSFISLRLILPKISEIAHRGCDIICLFKPQFEVGAKNLNKAGIVKDPKEGKKALKTLSDDLIDYGLILIDVIESPLMGKSGNREYLLFLKKENVPPATTYSETLDKL